MANKVYRPETIEISAFPMQSSDVIPSQSSTVGSQGQTLEPARTPTPQRFPEKLIATEVMSTAFNTQSRQILGVFEFAELGAIKIGKYENGVSGEVSITPNGIQAKNVNNELTFTLDGATGNATFKGTLQAGTVVAGAVNVGDPNVVLDGTNGRILIYDGVNYRVLIGKQVGGF